MFKKTNMVKVLQVTAFVALTLTFCAASTERASATDLKLGPLTATISSASFNYAKATGVEIGMNLSSSLDLAGHTVSMQINNLEMNQSGLKDATITIAPPSGQSNLVDANFGWADLSLSGATMDIVSGAVTSVKFAGSMTAGDLHLKTTDLTVASGRWTGTLVEDGTAGLSLAGISLSLASGGSIGLDIQGANDISVDFKNVVLDFSTAVGTPLSITFADISYANGAINATVTTPTTFTIHEWVTVTASNLVVDSPKPSGSDARVVTATMNSGTIKVNTPAALGLSDGITFNINNIVVSSDGTISGNITPPSL